ncbi:MAG: ABC transporter permease subunit [Chloroflexi bacterium]|nr:ABC transporter permease subunit [Chloroflexota bacterium]
MHQIGKSTDGGGPPQPTAIPSPAVSVSLPISSISAGDVNWSFLGNLGGLLGLSDASSVSDSDHFDDALGVRVGGEAYTAPATIDQVVGQPALDIPGPADYYQIISVILFLFSAIIAPELLCSDRRNGVLSLYLVRPLSTADYVIGRWLAFFVVSVVFIYAGQLVLQFGLILGAPEPLEYFKDNWLDIPRFLVAGIVIAAITTTIPLAVASFTTRRAYASAFVIGLFILSSVVAEILVECPDHDGPGGPPFQHAECEPLTGDFAKYAGLIAVGRTPIHISDMIFDKDNDSQLSAEVAKLNNGIPILWYLILVAAPGAILLQRYRGLSA